MWAVYMNSTQSVKAVSLNVFCLYKCVLFIERVLFIECVLFIEYTVSESCVSACFHTTVTQRYTSCVGFELN